jgi:hypothetical protein
MERRSLINSDIGAVKGLFFKVFRLESQFEAFMTTKGLNRTQRVCPILVYWHQYAATFNSRIFRSARVFRCSGSL